MYSFAFDRGFDLLDIRWSGLFCAREVSSYAAEVRRQFDRAGFRPGYLLRIDMRDAGVQSQAAIAAFRREFIGFPAAARIAIVTEGKLAALQVVREMRQPYLEVVHSADASLDWLVVGKRPAQPTLSSLPRFST